MNVAFLGLGGNMGNRLNNLKDTLLALEKYGTIVKASGIYETAAWGSDSDKKYLNQVVQFQTPLTPEALLEKVSGVEAKLGRVRTEQQNSDRTADIDILLYNDQVLDHPQLHIPHPRLHLRKFVLIPLCEIAPELVHPLLKKSMSELLKACNDDLEVKLVISL